MKAKPTTIKFTTTVEFTPEQWAEYKEALWDNYGEEIPYEKFGDQVVLNDNQKDYDPEVNALIYDLHSDVRNIKHHSGWYSRGDGQLKPENN